jgi:hypothetical protein
MTTIYLSSFLSWATGSLVDWNRPWLWLRLSILDPGDFGASWRSVPISGRAPQLPIAVASGEVTSLVTQTWSSLAVEDCQGQGLLLRHALAAERSPLVPRTIETMKLSDVLMQYSLPTETGNDRWQVGAGGRPPCRPIRAKLMESGPGSPPFTSQYYHPLASLPGSLCTDSRTMRFTALEGDTTNIVRSVFLA